MKRIRFVSEAEALTLVPAPEAAMISITEPNRAAPLMDAERWGALLRVRFCDAEYDAAMIAAYEARGKVFDADAKGFPSYATSHQVLAFLDALQGRADITELVVHCHAGQRRSAAVAKYAAERFPSAYCPDCTGYNETVYALLVDPTVYGQRAVNRDGHGGWLAKWRFWGGSVSGR